MPRLDNRVDNGQRTTIGKKLDVGGIEGWCRLDDTVGNHGFRGIINQASSFKLQGQLEIIATMSHSGLGAADADATGIALCPIFVTHRHLLLVTAPHSALTFPHRIFSFSPLMPAVLLSSSKSNPVAKMAAHATKSHSRVPRRRGRRPTGVHSDDEFERGAATDTDDESDDALTDSAFDSDLESGEDADTSSHAHRAVTPSTSPSPPPTDGVSMSAAQVKSFFSGQGNKNWSEMVTEDEQSGIPTIDFDQFNAEDEAQDSPRPVVSAVRDGDSLSASSASRRASTGDGQPHRRPVGMTARQAYQRRLENDPSYVPTVGEFWGHDDRLLDKDLRSLSGWWRGKWQGRGRGRGRGRGGFFGSRSDGLTPPNEEDISPVERPWNHDGFDELQRRDTARIKALRGGFRGRGISKPASTRMTSPASTATAPPPPSKELFPARPWYAMKPEHSWTKQHEAFLYNDPGSRIRGHVATYRVRLPGKAPQIVKGIRRPVKSAVASKSVSHEPDLTVHVRLPRGYVNQSEPPAESKGTPEQPATFEDTACQTAQASIEEVFTVRPELVPPPQPIPQPPPRSLELVSASLPEASISYEQPSVAAPAPVAPALRSSAVPFQPSHSSTPSLSLPPPPGITSIPSGLPMDNGQASPVAPQAVSGKVATPAFMMHEAPSEFSSSPAFGETHPATPPYPLPEFSPFGYSPYAPYYYAPEPYVAGPGYVPYGVDGQPHHMYGMMYPDGQMFSPDHGTMYPPSEAMYGPSSATAPGQGTPTAPYGVFAPPEGAFFPTQDRQAQGIYAPDGTVYFHYN
ncbi:hypothetical protein FISHEDRAFT_60234 [Fistulina hepatica ATCC 64428]|uniref:Btz domain-containing protein n=1 Tax=Fistulina hepatica ATCC 64428 TaxID=1128425 RepID=A0A0D7A7C8_9AGAR|nr:hypothetical protein FISHEDRAFT_60234 [Fistulina hepatica ATCC 64428]